MTALTAQSSDAETTVRFWDLDIGVGSRACTTDRWIDRWTPRTDQECLEGVMPLSCDFFVKLTVSISSLEV